jgi:hypothetical protein
VTNRSHLKDCLLAILLVFMFTAVIPLVVAQTDPPHPARNERDSTTLNSQAVSMVQPTHPSRARGMRGSVQVRVNIDKKGEVTAALAVAGPAIFYEAAEQAARKSKFTPGVRGLRLSYTFDDHIQERCTDRDVEIFNPQERHADNVWDLLTTTRGTQAVSLVARLTIEFLDSGEVGKVEIVAQSSPGRERTLLALAHRIAFVPACNNGRRVTITRMADFDEYGFRIREH